MINEKMDPFTIFPQLAPHAHSLVKNNVEAGWIPKLYCFKLLIVGDFIAFNFVELYIDR